ncbi:uncharacterized protein LOC131929460 [Physella acuta]|uniref:uncharacterized protein LOC131929460 n=1 Tax=Physella acuta TaxID=109671 RepID=UPI0027DE1B6A|nr:uncharacterized protein LOC131929460 [Physella acuta]
MEVLKDREDHGVRTETEERLKKRLEEMHVPFSKVKYLFSVWYKNDIIKSALAILDVTSLSGCPVIEAGTGQKIDQILDNSKESAILLTEFSRWPEMANVVLTLVENRNIVPDLVDVDEKIDNVMELFKRANRKGEIKRNNVLKDLTLRTSKFTCLTVKQSFTFLLFLVKMFDSQVDQQCLSEEELKTLLQNWSSDLSRTNDDLGLVMFVIISMITDVHHGQHLLVYQDTIQELKQRLVTSLHLSQVTFQVYCGENECRLGICNILLHLQRLSQQETFRAEFPEHCLFHLQSILLQSYWTRQQETELGLQILATDTTYIKYYIKDEPSLFFSLHACVGFLNDSQFTTQANNATKLLDLIASSLQAELGPQVERKKTRTENWKDEEKNELLSLIERHKREIECKGRTSECKKKVKQAWDDVTQEHRAKYPSRDLQKVKEKYQRMKSLSKQDMKRAKRDPHGSRLSGFTRRIFDICPEDFVEFKDLFESELNTGDTTEPDEVTEVVDGTNSASFQPSSSLNSEGNIVLR